MKRSCWSRRSERFKGGWLRSSNLAGAANIGHARGAMDLSGAKTFMTIGVVIYNPKTFLGTKSAS